MTLTTKIPDLMTRFESIARKYPDRIAIRDNGNEIRYGDLLQEVLRLADRLKPRGDVVGVFVSRSVHVVVAFLGVLAAGCVYCPIDPYCPGLRQRRLFQAAACRTIIRTAPRPDPSFDGDIIDLFERASAGTRESVESMSSVVSTHWSDPAYILFTSGSSGVPKGVVTPRGAISTSASSLTDVLEISASDRVLQFASLNWDTCFEEMLPTLTSGATLIFHADAYSGSFPRILRMLEAERITVLDLPTAFWHELVHFLAEERRDLPRDVRLVIIGGEAAQPGRIADWCELATDHVRLVNTYGCTETTLVTHAVDLHGPKCLEHRRDWRSVRTVPIGRRLPHVRERIGDDGELIVGGPALALGYQGLPELSAERFITLEGDGDGPQRYFKTGDAVRRGDDGNLYYQGRLDRQLKIRGIRVHPGEIEAELESHPRVAAAAVFGEEVARRTVVAAYVVPRSPADVPTLLEDLLSHMKARAPSHLIPTRISVVTELVYTGTGKLDRSASHEKYKHSNGTVLEFEEAQA